MQLCGSNFLCRASPFRCRVCRMSYSACVLTVPHRKLSPRSAPPKHAPSPAARSPRSSPHVLIAAAVQHITIQSRGTNHPCHPPPKKAHIHSAFVGMRNIFIVALAIFVVECVSRKKKKYLKGYRISICHIIRDTVTLLACMCSNSTPVAGALRLGRSTSWAAVTIKARLVSARPWQRTVASLSSKYQYLPCWAVGHSNFDNATPHKTRKGFIFTNNV